ncbi:MAG: dihydropteroate synthase [Candidatus Calescibacterium sp.]|nr:dihydropteroate synthase [Candidatus Calescibacterium sp.]MCX7733889.1 dihydropteroate synthase [bacterium]MDW8088036.1 dihydropteroate synthase [Candidatus Calescibacterium sp.]
MLNLPLNLVLPEFKFEGNRFLITTPVSGATLDLKENIYIMGILNVSPDSFYVGYSDYNEALKVAEKMVLDGADIIDVGGQSSRPGASEISPEEEKERIKIIKKLREIFPKVTISVDTYRAEVAQFAFDLGADMLNDISGFRFDQAVVDVCVRYGAPAVVMHTTAKPKIMQENVIQNDDDLIPTIKSYLAHSVKLAEERGVKVIIDPGIGFGKKPHQNLVLIKRIDEFVKMGYPVLLGASRKSFIGYSVSPQNPVPPVERLEGTIAVNVFALQKGVRIFRVHDVKENLRALLVSKAILSERF